MGEERYVDTLVPGYIAASSGIQFGEPCILGTRIPTRTLAGFIQASDSMENVARMYEISIEKVMAAVCFEAGFAWGRSRKRRKRMEQAVRQLWANQQEVRDG